MKYKALERLLLAALFGCAPLLADAAPVTLSENFAAIFEPAAPVNPVTGSFVISFDNSASVSNSTAGLQSFTINIATGGIGYNYYQSDDSLVIGGLLSGVNIVISSSNDFYLGILNASTNPVFGFLNYAQTTGVFNSFSGTLTPAATVPEPSSTILVLTALTAMGIACRKARRPLGNWRSRALLD